MAARNGHGPRKLSIAAPDKYRVIITWPGQRRPYQFSTSDRARARRIARHHAQGGAQVDFQVHENWGVYTTTHTYNRTDRTT
jgi:hypothetical protein